MSYGQKSERPGLYTSNSVIDCRSDTVTRPSIGIRYHPRLFDRVGHETMYAAKVWIL